MKKISIAILALITVFASCKKVPEVNLKYVDVERDLITVGMTTATVQCDYEYIATLKKAYFHYSEGQNEADMNIAEMRVVQNTLYVDLVGLKENTTYSYYYEFYNGFNSMRTEAKTFKTEASPIVVILPTVITAEVTEITENSAQCGGEATNDGGAEVTERGICWGVNANPTLNDSYIASGTGIGAFTAMMNSLEANTTYHVRAYATNEKGTAYGLDREFTTVSIVVLPTVIVGEISEITTNSAQCSGEVTSDGGAEVTERGICWSTNANPTVSDSHVASGSGIGSFTSTMSGLTANTTYHVRAYATNSVGTAYSSDREFTTLSGGGGSGVPEGAISGLFTINANGDQVYFSQGNLQYQASTNTWRFAENQWDYVGDDYVGTVYENGVKCDNSQISSSYDGWIDLFGWGTSGYHNPSDPYNLNYQPWSNICNVYVNYDYNYFGYGPSTNMTSPDLTGSSANYDWGVNNPISNGGNIPNQWRTFVMLEWNYVIGSRNTPSGILFAMAYVNEVMGMILLPDDWNEGVFGLNHANETQASPYVNTITATQWVVLEQHGAVFIPAAGNRAGNYINGANLNCCYWTASHVNSNCAYAWENNYPYERTRDAGYSVRLVKDANK